MNKKKAGPAKVKDPAEVKSMVMEWLERENKPVTPQSLTDALGSRVGKPLVQRTLEKLLTQGALQGKDLKKVRFFYLNTQHTDKAESGSHDGALTTSTQPGSDETDVPVDGTPAGNEEEEARRDDAASEGEETSDQGADETSKDNMEDLRKALIAEIVAGAKALREREEDLAKYRSLPTAAERAARLEAFAAEVSQLQDDVVAAEARADAAAQREVEKGGGAAAGGTEAVSRALDDAIYSYQKARALWKERKEFTDRLIEGVLGDNCSTAELAEMFGITTDAEAGISFVESAVQLPLSFATSSSSPAVHR